MADTRRMLLEPGKWWGGYHAPLFISTSMIQSFLEKQGFTDFTFEDREPEHPLPSYVNPKADPRYKDDWEAWLSATYNGPKRSVEIPHYEYADWVLVQVKASAPAKPPVEKSGIQWSEVFLVGGVLWLLTKGRKRRR